MATTAAATATAQENLPFTLDDCIAAFTVEEDYDYPHILKRINCEVEHPTHPNVASLSAFQIDRRRCRGQFLQVMDDESQELHEFSVKLFNKFGHLKPELVDNDYHKGTGCWGREMDRGMLIYVESIEVNPSVSMNMRRGCRMSHSPIVSAQRGGFLDLEATLGVSFRYTCGFCYQLADPNPAPTKCS